MANSPRAKTDPGGTLFVDLDTTATIPLGWAHNSYPSQFMVQVVGTGWTGSLVPKQAAIGAGLSGGNLKTCVYYESDGETAIAAGVGITGDGIFYIFSDGLETHLDYTHTAGSVRVYFVPLIG